MTHDLPAIQVDQVPKRSARPRPHRTRLRWRRGIRAKDLQGAISRAARQRRETLDCLLENRRLIQTAAMEAAELTRSLDQYPVTPDGLLEETPRVCSIAHDYLETARDDFSEDGFTRFVEKYQESAELEMGEIWALKPALQLALLERLVAAPGPRWPVLISSLRQIGEAPWKDLFESINLVDRILDRDPAGAYAAMDYESRDQYRHVIASLATRSPLTELEIAETAIAHAFACCGESSSRRSRRAHVGFYLVDNGVAELRDAIGYRPRAADRLRDAVLHHGTAFYLGGIEVVTFITVAMLLSGLDRLTPVLAGLLLLLLPATQAATEFMNNLVAWLVPARPLPKLDFSEGIPDNCATLVAVPTLLLTEAQVQDLVLDLEVRYLANRDSNLTFALVADSPDSNRPVDERDALVGFCRELIEALNRRYQQADGRSPFLFFHRHRVFNASEGRWMGWERKRGKLLDLNRLLRRGFDSFPTKAGDLSMLSRIRYVITLDSDTQLPRDSAARLVGTIAHPLNRAVVDPATKMVVEGYGILQPRIGISIQSASRTRLAAIYSGQTGFDIYTRAVSDVYQDLFGCGSFTGKGIYDVDVLREVLEHRFPENALLSHDLIEGAYARSGLVSDVELIDDYPSHFSAYSRRKHRWVRGDWQIMRWLLLRVPDYHGRTIANPIDLISRWKIVDNLRRSILEPSLLVLLVAGWLYLPGPAWYWTAATLALLFLPATSNLLFSVVGQASWPIHWGRLRDTAAGFLKGCGMAVLSLVFLPHQALLSMDAIARSMLRVLVTKKRLLEWETAAEAELVVRSRARVDVYLSWMPYISAALAVVVSVVNPAALPVALPVLALWFASRFISAWLNGAPRGRRHLSEGESQLIRESAERICQFFQDWSSPATNWLIPDYVDESGEAALRLSPTNLGMLLNARIAAVHLGALPVTRFAGETRRTLETVLGLPKYRGHLLNWYDIKTLAPLEPRFVSTVDSGNLAGALWTLKQAALAFAAERGATAAVAAELAEIADICDRIVRQMDFRFLYDRRKKVLSVGFDVSTGRLSPSSYDLLASESRLGTFIAVAKGDIPQEAWFGLGRGHTLAHGETVLLSWTGTMFEYLMPALWMRCSPGTIIDTSMQAAVRIQRKFAHKQGVPWGISESACASDTGHGHGYTAFGIPELALKPKRKASLVISPYSTFLALAVAPRAAAKNLRRMEALGWTGRYGYYEAVDYSHGEGQIIRCWMAHHQGMSLLAACNLLFGEPMQRYFHSEPQVLATELVLHERVPSVVVTQPEPGLLPNGEVLGAAA